MRTQWSVTVLGLVLIGIPLLVSAEEIPTHTWGSALSTFAATQVAGPRNPIDQLAARYTTPKAVAEFLRRDFTFRRDEDLFGVVDQWQTPEEFATRKAGDCEDYALLARAILQRNGVESYVFSLFGESGYAHTVAVFVDQQGRYNVINQGKIRYYHASSIEALASMINPAWSSGGIVEQDGARGRMVREIHNAHPAVLAEDLPNL